MTVTCSLALNLLSAAFGMAGTFLLYKGSFAFEQPAEYMSTEQAQEMSSRNKNRLLLQRSGLVFLFFGFLLQGVAQVIS